MNRRALALLPLVLVSAGCFEGQRTIRVKADGSGTVVDTLVLGEQMKAMVAAADTDQEAVAKEKAKYAAAAKAMGPGVRFVGEEKTPQGIKATFAFDDIRTARIGISPGPDDDSSGKKSQPLTFRLAREGTKSMLTVVQPRPAPKPKVGTDPAVPDAMNQMGMAMWTMMKPMMKGLKLRTVLEVDGTIVRTTSALASGPAVTLLDLDFDQITASDANFKKFSRAGEDPSAMDPKLLQAVKGIKVSPEHEVVIEFTGR